VRIEVVDGRPDPYAAAPTLVLRLAVTDERGGPVHAAVLRAQIRIEPQRRRYSAAEERRLLELFGETPQWGDSLRPFRWTDVATTVPGFAGRCEIDLPVPCTYDFDIAAAKYLHALGDGEVPLLLLFSGTVFSRSGDGLAIEPIAWDVEASYRLPVRMWRALMDAYFPNTGWLRVGRDTLDALARFKAERALTSWDDAFERLLTEAER
jgi:hypothetical protein